MDNGRRENDFYRGKFFEELNMRLDRIEERQESQGKNIDDIKSKIYWVYGAVAVVTFSFNIAWGFVRDKISKSIN